MADIAEGLPDVIRLGRGDPDLDTPAHIVKAGQEALGNGTSVIVDESYIRESILNPQAKLVAGYQPLMPTFQGLVNE